MTLRPRLRIMRRADHAEMAESVDARVSEARDGNIVEVQVLFSASYTKAGRLTYFKRPAFCLSCQLVHNIGELVILCDLFGRFFIQRHHG